MKEKIKNFRFTRKAFAYPYMLFLLVFVVTPLVLILANAFIYDGKFSFKNFAIFFTEKSSLVAWKLHSRRTSDDDYLHSSGISRGVLPCEIQRKQDFRIAVYPAHVGKLPDKDACNESDFRVAEHSARNGNGRVRHGLQLSAVYDTSFAHGAFEH